MFKIEKRNSLSDFVWSFSGTTSMSLIIWEKVTFNHALWQRQRDSIQIRQDQALRNFSRLEYASTKTQVFPTPLEWFWLMPSPSMNSSTNKSLWDLLILTIEYCYLNCNDADNVSKLEFLKETWFRKFFFSRNSTLIFYKVLAKRITIVALLIF